MYITGDKDTVPAPASMGAAVRDRIDCGEHETETKRKAKRETGDIVFFCQSMEACKRKVVTRKWRGREGRMSGQGM